MRYRTIMDIVNAQNGAMSVVKSLERNQGIIDMARSLDQNRTALAMLSGKTGIVRSFEGNRTLTDAVRAANPVHEMLKRNRTALDSILGNRSYAEMIGANSAVSQIISQPRFASLVGTVAVPRAAWRGVLDGVREPIGADLYDEALDVFEGAADEAGEGDGATWWLARLPLVAQLGLLQVVLQSLDAIGQAMVSLAGDEVPTEYQDGAQILFALATALYAFMAARVDVLSKH